MLSFIQAPVYPVIAVTDDMRRQSLNAALAHVNMLTTEYAITFGYADGWTPLSEAAERIMGLLMSDEPVAPRAFVETLVFAANVCDDMVEQIYPDTIDVSESIALWEKALALAAAESEAA